MKAVYIYNDQTSKFDVRLDASCSDIAHDLANVINEHYFHGGKAEYVCYEMNSLKFKWDDKVWLFGLSLESGFVLACLKSVDGVSTIDSNTFKFALFSNMAVRRLGLMCDRYQVITIPDEEDPQIQINETILTFEEVEEMASKEIFSIQDNDVCKINSRTWAIPLKE